MPPRLRIRRRSELRTTDGRHHEHMALTTSGFARQDHNQLAPEHVNKHARGGRIDSAGVRVVSYTQARVDRKLKEELDGTADRQAVEKVTLPKLTADEQMLAEFRKALDKVFAEVEGDCGDEA